MTAHTVGQGTLFRHHVSRPRLTSLLDGTSARTILLVAPAGYGKTVLAREWAAEKRHTAWFRATPESADLATLSTGIATAADAIVHGAGSRLLQRLRVGVKPDDAVALAELLAEDLSESPEGACLVIDDYHLFAESAAAERFVGVLLAKAPIRGLVTSRRRPDWATARGVMHGEIAEIGADQLAMTAEEARGVLRRLSDRALRNLVSQARGWPVVIGLAAIADPAPPARDAIADALFRYFAEEILRRRPREIQRFMCVAAVPPTLTPDVARALSDVDDVEEILEELSSEGVLRRADAARLEFHPLLRTFLRRRLAHDDPELSEHVVTGSIAKARTERRWEEAFDLAVEEGRRGLAAEIVDEAAPALLAAGRVETLERWLEACGDVLPQTPSLLVTLAELRIRQDRQMEARALAREVISHLPSGHPSAARAWNVAGQAAHLLAEEREALECHLRAKDCAQTDHDRRRGLDGAFLAAVELELELARDLLDEIESLASDELDDRLRLANGRFHLAMSTGTCAGLWPVFEAFVPLAEHADDPGRKAVFLKNAAELSIARARYATARGLASDAVEACKALHLDAGTWICLVQRAQAEIGLRAFAPARRTMREIDRFLDEHENPGMSAYRLMLTAKLAISRGQSGDLIASEHALPDGTAVKNLRGTCLGLLAIAAAAGGDTRHAGEHAKAARELTKGVAAQFYSAFAELLIACVEGDRSARPAQLLVQRAVEHDFLDGLVLAYRAYPPLLPVLAADAETRPTLARVLDDAQDHELARAVGVRLWPPGHAAGAAATLTRREQEVLSLMSEGLSNDEIAQRLVIARGTVKVHVHHILRKLGAQTRTQAARTAAELLAPSSHG